MTPEPPGHHLGRPHTTAYQLAIALHTRYPEAAHELGFEIGGVDTGRHNSLAQYLGQQLSTRIALDGDASAIEGAFLSSRPHDDPAIRRRPRRPPRQQPHRQRLPADDFRLRRAEVRP
ncbi:hypothetical protein [Amycolatopsis sp. NPDC004625]|uniref:hypothetical protein n=1 Tax=Amycolatopsis sp. NPDC004625 TaxID=3154670 RepID=UPI0033BCB921